MKLLLDTNVISEVTRPQPDEQVMLWLNSLDEDRTFISVASLAELSRGVALLPAGRRREALAHWLTQDLPSRFEGRVIAIDPEVAGIWGKLMARAAQSGFVLSVMDGFFAATAEAHGLVLATRNVKDFAPLGIQLFNPWTDEVGKTVHG